MGKPMYVAMISNADNIAHLDKLKEINKQLAVNPNLSEQQRSQMIKNGKVFIYATLSMHSNEVGPSQASPLIAYELITTKDPQIRNWLDKTVYMMVPCHNPDGMDMVVNNYLKYRAQNMKELPIRVCTTNMSGTTTTAILSHFLNQIPKPLPMFTTMFGIPRLCLKSIRWDLPAYVILSRHQVM